MALIHLFRAPGIPAGRRRALLGRVRDRVSSSIHGLRTEYCFNIDVAEPLTQDELQILTWLLAETFEPDGFGPASLLDGGGSLIEVGPRMNFTTAWSTNAVSVCHACGLAKVRRIERSRRYLLRVEGRLTDEEVSAFINEVHDRMTECPYPEPLTSFETGVLPETSIEIPVLQDGRRALERVNQDMGLAFDDWDLDYYTDLFANRIGRNPTNVECFDIAQSNSEHSRHWFFRGRLVIDGEEMPGNLFSVVQDPLSRAPRNSVVAFRDNSSAILGYPIRTIVPVRPGEPSPFHLSELHYHVTFTAETHNFPSGVAPFPGAETGTGGRIRDVHATGTGSLVVAGTAAYCVGNLRIPGYSLPWEDPEFTYPENLASPVQIEIEASDGASDYGNKFGEPVILGFTRSFGQRLPSGERREWIKPIMFSGGIGQMDSRHTEKGSPDVGMCVVKIGGPAYRIGMGGGAASSMVQGENVAELDFNAVQRGDAEMEQKVNRVIRSCVELGEQNPIISIHDQGAGGNCNVLKEIVEPAGARIEVRKIPVGDDTLSVLEIWGAEYQEQDALLLHPEAADLFRSLAAREKVPVAFVGRITGDGRIVLYDETDDSTPVNLDLDTVLGEMPQKTFELQRIPPTLRPLSLPADLSVETALDRVLRLLSVGSKRFLTTKVDRAVTGLVARQQCAGPLQLTVSNVAVIAQSHFGATGAATSIGEQPIKGLMNPCAMARMSVGEALTNLVWAKVSALEDVKCSANWMWAAKLPGEGAALHDAALAMRDLMVTLGIAVDGGKDSLSMAAYAPAGGGAEETVKAPGTLVISTYVTCPDITRVVTPDLELPGRGRLLYVDLGSGKYRLGGSALAQVYGQIGDQPPDLEDPELLKRAFRVVQTLIDAGQITAGHDRSDGGLVTTLLEMAFAGNCGIDVQLDGSVRGPIPLLFSEELGLVLEVQPEDEPGVLEAFESEDVPCLPIGVVRSDPLVRVQVGSQVVLEEDVRDLRDLWEQTSFELDRLQANPECVTQERTGLRYRTGPTFVVPFAPSLTAPALLEAQTKPRVAIVREEGSNGDREMASAFFAAGFEPWDVAMSDLQTGRVDLTSFRGMAFVGGFSYADVLDSAKGWAGAIRLNPSIWQQFEEFHARPDTFSLGVCNGCQLLALLGWVPWRGITDEMQPRFIHNASGRFESRFASVAIQKSPSIMLEGMEGATLGIWVQHGEGRAYFPERSMLDRVLDEGLAPIRYVDDDGRITEAYPFNPNGSPAGVAALCSRDGRHLALMPHPERTFRKWQWGWMPEGLRRTLNASPWLRMFQNARTWCDQVSPTPRRS
jgi:phosphoribosylformylglycinamidine synthase